MKLNSDRYLLRMIVVSQLVVAGNRIIMTYCIGSSKYSCEMFFKSIFLSAESAARHDSCRTTMYEEFK